MIIKKLEQDGLICPPKWLADNTHYLCVMGSVAYGVSNDTSDMDVYGWCIPPKHYIFPHINGVIFGFDKSFPQFEQWSQHHITDKNSRKEYDFAVYSIVKYFRLCMDNNPNMIDSLFVPRRCVIHASKIGEMVLRNRELFLHKGSFHKFKGYLFSQLTKAKKPNATGKRKADIERLGYCPKFLYHVVRLTSELEQILREGTLVLDEKGRREHMKAVRNATIGYDDVVKWFNEKERVLEQLYASSSLPYKPQMDKIKDLLLSCLEEHYGSLDNTILRTTDKNSMCINEIMEVLKRYDYC